MKRKGFLLLSLAFVFAFPLFVWANFIDNSNDEEGFGGAAHYNTQWDAGNSWVELSTATSSFALPNSASTTSWFDMSNNVLLYHLDESAGDILDTSGNGIDGTLTDATYSASGKIHKALSFDGTNDQVSIPSDADLNMDGGNFTLGMWVKWSSGDLMNVIQIGEADYGTRFLFATDNGGVGSSGGMIFGFLDGAGNLACYTFGSALNNDQWHHVVATRSGATLKTYVDGISLSFLTFEGCIVATDANLLGEGGYTDFAGQMDEIGIWSQALTANEVFKMYTLQKEDYSGYLDSRIMDNGSGATIWTTLSWVPKFPSGKELPDNGGVETAYNEGNIDMTNSTLVYHLNEASGTIVDSSGNSLDGTVTGATYGVNGKLNTALSFDGTNDRIDLPTDAVLDMNGGDFSISLWAQYTGAGTTNILQVGEFDYTTHFSVGVNGSNGFSLAFNEDDSGVGSCYYDIGSGLSLNNGNWHLFTAIRSAGVYTFYLDGVLIEGYNSSLAGGCFFITDANIIGEGPYADFNGQLDEVAIWSKAISATDVLNIYKRGSEKLRFQVRSCNDAACAGETFVGPNGTIASFYSELTTSTTSTPAKDIFNIGENQYFQYRSIFESASSTLSPYLNSVTIANLIPGITITQSDGTTTSTEGGATDSYTLVLDSEPNSTVTITITPDAQSTVSTSSIIFSTSTWDSLRTVTVTAVDDADVEGEHISTITQTVASDDSHYDGFFLADITVNIADNDEENEDEGGDGISHNGGGETNEGTPMIPSSTPIMNTSTIPTPETLISDEEVVILPESSVPAEMQCVLSLGQPYKSLRSSAVYLIDTAHHHDGTINKNIPCAKRIFPSPNLYFTYFDSWNPVQVIDPLLLEQVPFDDFESIPIGPRFRTTTGALIKLASDTQVYLLFGQQKHWIETEAVFRTADFFFEFVIEVGKNIFDAIITGDSVQTVDQIPLEARRGYEI